MGELPSFMKYTDDLTRCPRLLRRWTKKWGVPELAGVIVCEWSTRLRRSLGRAYPKRHLIRLSVLLENAEFAELFDEVLCHEAAHVAVFHLHGSTVMTHGTEWEELVRMAGYQPRRSLETELLRGSRDPNDVEYRHICPICHTTRTSKRPQPNWGCVACQQSGLDGTLVIQSYPRTMEDRDV